MKWIVTYPEKAGESAYYLWTRLGMIRANPVFRMRQATRADVDEWSKGEIHKRENG